MYPKYLCVFAPLGETFSRFFSPKEFAMKVVSCVALLLALLIDASPASATIRARSRTVVRNRQAKVRHVNRQEVKLVVPFAVPVGVPVAPFSPYFYGYQQFR